MKKILFVLSLLTIIPSSMMAYSAKIDGIYYDLNSSTGTATVTYKDRIVSNNANAYTGDVVIPETFTYNGILYSVTTIGPQAFYGCSNLTSVSIPEGVTKIGTQAFYDCSKLTSVSLPPSLTSIETASFSGCSRLSSVDIPNSVNAIGSSAFSECKGLTSVVIPAGLTNIESHTFQDCTNLTSVTIPNSVKGILSSAFKGCTKLTSITIPNSVKTIEQSAFYGCTRLVSVSIGSGVVSVNWQAFANCNALEVVTCYATLVPSSSSSPFDTSRIVYATLVVPDEAYDAYCAADYWKYFGYKLKMSEILTITANSYTRDYGDENPVFEYTSGIEMDGIPEISCTADATSAPGIYPITISRGTVTNSIVTFVDGALTVNKAPLTANVNNFTISVGEFLPTFDAVFTGLKNGETDAVLNPVFSCTATDSNTPGIYDIILSVTTDNYDVTIENGTLTIAPQKVSLTISNAGVATYCSPFDLDFSQWKETGELKAYTIGGYDKVNKSVYAMRVYDVPAGTGLYLVGNPADYDVPVTTSGSFYVNMLVGTFVPITLQPTDGDYTNFILYGTSPADACFRPTTGGPLKGNRAYLQIPTAMLSSNANSLNIVFDDETDGINEVAAASEKNAWYTLDGRKLNGAPVQKGIYINGGRKVMVK